MSWEKEARATAIEDAQRAFEDEHGITDLRNQKVEVEARLTALKDAVYLLHGEDGLATVEGIAARLRKK